MSVGDKTLVCRDCGENFTFTAGEQAFYLERGFVEPARCPNCRASRRQSRQNGDLGGVGAPRGRATTVPSRLR